MIVEGMDGRKVGDGGKIDLERGVKWPISEKGQ